MYFSSILTEVQISSENPEAYSEIPHFTVQAFIS